MSNDGIITAASAMSGLERQLDVCAKNLSNARTPGFHPRMSATKSFEDELGDSEQKLVTTLFFDTNDEQQTTHAYEAYGKLVVELGKAGYPIYRTNLQNMDLVAEQFDWGNHAQRRLNERLKDMLDPNGILSPGKQGIWPKGMRPAR